MRGLTVSLLLLAGAPALLFAGVLADKFGHLSITFVGAVIFTIGAALETRGLNLAMLLVGRNLFGIGEGLYLGNMNVYICEIAPKARRSRWWSHSGFGILSTASVISLASSQRQAADRNLKKLDLTEDEILINSDVLLDKTEDPLQNLARPDVMLCHNGDLINRDQLYSSVGAGPRPPATDAGD
ncbi:hypothetical protein MBLNU13_g07119t1 [Cladosporium sp. NU13]